MFFCFFNRGGGWVIMNASIPPPPPWNCFLLADIWMDMTVCAENCRQSANLETGTPWIGTPESIKGEIGSCSRIWVDCLVKSEPLPSDL